MKITIGTRRSKLAMWQAHFVKDQLEHEGIEIALIPIETKGDKVLDVSIAKIGSKGVFTEELEQMLADGTIDLAVHSAKDVQSILPEGFEIIAFSAREKEHDVLLSFNKSFRLDNPDASFVIGTSSTRRIATLAHYYPKISTVEMRGNLQTRIAKLESGYCDALLLAYAGVFRMGYEDMISQELPLHIFTPAVGQGSLAIEVAKGLSTEKKKRIREILNNSQAESKLLAERAYLGKLKGGCSIPAFANAQVCNDQITLTSGIFSLDGQQLICKTHIGAIDYPESIGSRAGEDVLNSGGDKILEHINKKLNR
jgi:hydroxymethylbilane synthase